ncbi:MAG: hypothetical protein NTV29_18750, partial [Planctomycetota bacterium]|nr:hypothetical protein [Planctomycetota bacterium]
MTLRAVYCLLCGLLLGLIGSAQGPSEPALPDASLYACRWASTPPKIDGVADDPCWEHAPTISNFRASWLATDPKSAPVASGQVDSSDSIPTEAKMVWDKEYLYVWAKLTDKDIQGTITQRDEQTWLDDCFEL